MLAEPDNVEEIPGRATLLLGHLHCPLLSALTMLLPWTVLAIQFVASAMETIKIIHGFGSIMYTNLYGR
jgi:hypothetical protein